MCFIPLFLYQTKLGLTTNQKVNLGAVSLENYKHAYGEKRVRSCGNLNKEFLAQFVVSPMCSDSGLRLAPPGLWLAPFGFS